jgi:flagellin-specific chaperone FliS
MQNQEIIKIIENLKSRRDYEQKKATKLGFNSLYAYFEDKILKEKKVVEDEKGELELIKDHYKIMNEDKKKKTCSCC